MNRINLSRLGARKVSEGEAGAGNRRRFRPGTIVAVGLIGVMVFLAVALFTYDGGSSTPGARNIMSPPAMPTTAPAAGNTATEAFAPSAAPGKMAYADSAAEQPATGGTASTAATSQQWDRMLIREANIQLTVTDVGAAVDSVISLAASRGGRVLRMESHQSGDYTISSVTLQVPANEFDRALQQLRKLDGQVKKVESENVSSQDVTEEYTDLQSQLRNLQATEARMLALQQKADKLEDILTLDRELRQIQAQIEQITGRTNYLSKRSEMSQITVGLSPEGVAQPQPIATTAWDPLQIAERAWNASLDLLSKLGTVLISVVVFLWWAVPLVLIGWWLMRRSGRRPASTTASTTGSEPA